MYHCNPQKKLEKIATHEWFLKVQYTTKNCIVHLYIAVVFDALFAAVSICEIDSLNCNLTALWLKSVHCMLKLNLKTHV